MNKLTLIAPELFLSAAALLFLLGEAFFEKARRTFIYVAIGCLLAVLAALCFCVPLGATSMFAFDAVSVFFKIALVSSVVIVLWFSLDYYEFADVPLGLYSFLLLLGTVGMMLLVSATDLLIAVIALELLSITSFILTGFVFQRRSSSEAAIKFFLVGSLSTALLLFGISYYYGYFGTTSLTPLINYPLSGQTPDMVLSFILVMLVAGLGFKLALVPFHMWAPDAYEGAPTPITAFLSVAPKAAAIGFLLRFGSHHEALHFTPVLAGLAALTMSVGNIGAILQTNVKRLMAYSSIAQVGYILTALVAGGPSGSQAAMIYTFVYLFMNLGVFSVLVIVANNVKSEELELFSGLSKKSLGLSMVLVVFLLSMTGLPPMAGFVGKFTIFSALMQKPNLLWLGVVAVLNSVVSLYYYFKIVQQMFFKEPVAVTSPLRLSPAHFACLIVTGGVTLGVGLLPNSLITWVRSFVGI